MIEKNKTMALNTEEDVQLAFRTICSTVSEEQYREIKIKYAKRFGHHRNAIDATINEMIFSIVNGGNGGLFNKLQKLLMQEYSKVI